MCALTLKTPVAGVIKLACNAALAERRAVDCDALVDIGGPSSTDLLRSGNGGIGKHGSITAAGVIMSGCFPVKPRWQVLYGRVEGCKCGEALGAVVLAYLHITHQHVRYLINPPGQ